MKHLSQELITSPEVQDFILQHLNADVRALALKKSPIEGISSGELAQQIQAKKAAKSKMPTWFSTTAIIFPPKLNMEQASSEQTAQYKSTLLKPGKVVDLTGGFGVDDYYFAQKATEVIHCELNEELSDLVAHNAKVLGTQNIHFIKGDSAEYLKSLKHTNNLYVDPSRRNSSGRTFLLEDCEPNVVTNLPLYLEKADRVIIKASPVLDIQAALSSLRNVSSVHVVSVHNECKELLFIIDKGYSGETKIVCALLGKEKQQTFPFSFEKEKELKADFFPIQDFLYEPDVAFLKAGLFKTIAVNFNLHKLHQHSHLYTSDTLIDDFPGRSLKVKEIFDYKSFSAKKAGIGKANVIVRNFPGKPDALKKKFKINDGGSNYLYFTTDKQGNKKVIRAELV